MTDLIIELSLSKSQTSKKVIELGIVIEVEVKLRVPTTGTHTRNKQYTMKPPSYCVHQFTCEMSYLHLPEIQISVMKQNDLT